MHELMEDHGLPSTAESCLLQEYSLLELPDLVLEEIAKNLRPQDLACCMRTCTTLRDGFKTRQNALVRVRIVCHEVIVPFRA